MSAFVVQDITINRIIGYLSMDRESDHIRKQIEQNTGANINGDEGRKVLAEAMFKLNCNAVEQRYGEGEAKEFRPLDFTYRYEACRLMQAYKSLGSWLYQCAEGDVPDTSLLYATMKEVHADMAHTLVGRMKEYETAKWD